ncbi:dynamin family protein [Fibrobacter intestinalis]|uniref:Dynamin family protein n=1 Tax=Fibrobacter intestinalis TaxID=28122 RepID=A0A1T4RDG2_9BACT|nr:MULTISPECIES: dynamin family protein [Fibrobacter]PBC73509.1 dynamin family protein [Fibrobacter sp. NR9]SKA14064.1 Dynamin family protein [Fibrobacter intestinalis]
MNAKIKFLEIIDKVSAIAQKCDVSCEKAKALAQTIKSQELLVPVVGEFSAGKSTFLNSFIGRPILSVDVSPETAVATELRYSEKEFAEIVEDSGEELSVKKVSIEETHHVKPSWRSIRLYLNSENLKRIEPIIFVDMPGFDSPRDDHNRAIASYLNRGVHYVVLTSVESGTITSSMSRQLQDIQNMGRDFSFFVSKTNLRSPEDVSEIIEEMKDRIEDALEIERTPQPLGKNAGAELVKLVSSIDPENLFLNIFKDPLLELIDEVADAIQIKISALKLDKDKNRAAIQEMNDSLARLEQRRDLMIAEAKSNRFDEDADTIVNAAGASISSKVEELTEMAMKGASSESISQEINATVRSSIIPAINKISQESASKISTSFQVELRELNATFSNLENPDFVAKIGTAASNLGNFAKESLASLTAKADKQNGYLKPAYKTIVGALGIMTNVFAPVLEIVLLFLPEIIGLFTQHQREVEKREQIRSQILNSIPKMKQELREKIGPILTEQKIAAINAISEQFDSKIDEMKNEISKANEALENNEDIVEKMKEYEEAELTLKKLKDSI